MSTEIVITIVVIILGIQSVLLITLALRNNFQSPSYKYLSLVLFFYLLSILNFAVFKILEPSTYYQWTFWLQLELLYGFGPSLFLYSKTLTDKSYQLRKIEWLHFLPVVIELIYYRLPLFRHGALNLAEKPESFGNWVFHIVQWGGLVSVLVYLFLIIRLLARYRHWIRDRHSNLENKELSWLEIPIVIYSFFWVLWVSLRIVDIIYYGDTLRPYYFNAGFLILSIITFWVCFKGYVSSKIGTSGFLNSPVPKPIMKIEQKELLSIAHDLQEKMKSEQFYLDSDLTLKKLAQQIGCSENTISKALNSCLGLSFHQFVNQYRIDAFKRNLERQELSHLNFLGIALESGFGSKSTFNLVFKKNTGITPKQYLDQVVREKS